MTLYATKGVEHFKGGLFLEGGDYSTYTFMKIFV